MKKVDAQLTLEYLHFLHNTASTVSAQNAFLFLPILKWRKVTLFLLPATLEKIKTE